MPNRLANEVSPYLLQHKDNPVDWRPWGAEALDEARRTGRPILLSVGYAACHWCHVMAHESFENEATARVMNDLFVNIKVDREERPDIDQIYMSALHALGEQGGWPLTMFLTPDGHPIWGGTYFPPTARFGRPGFTDVCREIARLFRDEPDRIGKARDAVMTAISRPPESGRLVLDAQLLDAAADRLAELMDPDHGGTKGAPKFPQTSLFECLARAGIRTGEARYRDIVATTFDHICQGGIYDHIGGGFARYATDERWLVPHFEKMLYDNAQIVEQLAHLHAATPNRLYADRIAETVAWLAREMTVEGGGFAASLDADSEGEEGRFYVWRRDEIDAVLPPDDAALFAATYDVTPRGNWEGKSIPNRLRTLFPGDSPEEERLATIRATLRDHRAKRIPPGRDDKVLADWNGLMIAALARASFLLDRPEWLEPARTAYRFVCESLIHHDRLGHAFRAGRTVFPGLATDHAFMIKAALAMYEATSDPACLADAERWTATLRAHHADPDRPGFFLSANDADDLILRPRADTDDAIPAATSVMASNLVRLWHLTGNDGYRFESDSILEAGGGLIARNLYAATSLLNALDLRLNARLVVLVAPAGTDAGPMLAAIRSGWTHNTVYARHDGASAFPADHPAHGKTAIAGRPTVYVCREGSCSPPVTNPDDLARVLSAR